MAALKDFGVATLLPKCLQQPRCVRWTVARTNIKTKQEGNSNDIVYLLLIKISKFFNYIVRPHLDFSNRYLIYHQFTVNIYIAYSQTHLV